MNFIGKILVIVIMASSLVFLGVSTVVFTTATNWKEAASKRGEEVKKIQAELGTLTEAKEKLEEALKVAQGDHVVAVKGYETRITALGADMKKAQDEITAARGLLGEAQTNAKSALDETDARRKEVDELRQQLTAVEKQSNEFKIRQTELNDKILELSRSLEVAEKNSKDLRERSLKLATLLRERGLSTDVTNVDAQALPESVEGRVLKVDGSKMELSIGSDDGLSIGHELSLVSAGPNPQYIGKVKITMVDPDQAVASVVGKTINGKKIREGDIVTSTLNSR